jgi:hypothetical protein
MASHGHGRGGVASARPAAAAAAAAEVFDVAVVGAGVMGSATAYYAAK